MREIEKRKRKMKFYLIDVSSPWIQSLEDKRENLYTTESNFEMKKGERRSNTPSSRKRKISND